MRFRVMCLILICLFTVPALAKDFTVKAVKGIVEVRRGVSEEWRKVKVGDLLKPEDSMRTGENSSATVEIETSRMVVPPMTIIDFSDLRQLSREDFLLQLAMENILAVPPRDRDEIEIPSATVLHGANREKERAPVYSDETVGRMQLQGAKVLFDNAYYATSILKAKATLRSYPDLRSDFDARITVALAFEKLKLDNEAITEYSLLGKEDLPAVRMKQVQASLERLKAAK
jgi:hypothetical protein